MNLTNAELIALIIRDGIPAALQIAQIANRPPAEQVDPQDLARLQALSERTADAYKEARQS